MNIIWTGFVLGMMGSVHCVGMCGPLAAAVPSKPDRPMISALLFNGGRVLTYGFIGVVLGLVGFGINLMGLQSYLSVFTGILLLGALVYPQLLKGKLGRNPLAKKINLWMVARMKQLSFGSIFTLGMLNGLLPCGLIWVALAGAMETGYVETAGLYMVLFGIGNSIPLFMIKVSKDFFLKLTAWRPKRMVPYLSFGLAVFFILRGSVMMLPADQANSRTIEFLQTITLCNGY
ncbi:MAG: sulfite exporter TauE/SafE family protein [Cyclobacteriaceae bacterium]